MKFKVDPVELGEPLPLASRYYFAGEIAKDSYGEAWASCKSPPKNPYRHQHTEQENSATYAYEQSSDLPANAVMMNFNQKNLFVESALAAFKNHYPLKIKPDIVWITIMQGFARHIDKNAEKFRGKFVAHEGKKEITIVRNGFVKSGQNDWPNCFPEFSDKIEENLVDPEIRNLVECNYTTTSNVDKVVSQIALMDTVKNYFSFKVLTRCGIPEIELAGEIDDWIKLREKTEQLLSQFELDFWLEHLLPILDRFIAAFKGDIDTKFWGSIAKLHSTYGSGASTYLNGWIQDFFPYLCNGSLNRCIGAWRAEFEKTPGSDDAKLQRYYRSGGMDYADVPIGLNTCPFIWEYYGKTIPMHFVGAISAVIQDPESLQLEAVTGWGILEETNSKGKSG